MVYSYVLTMENVNCLSSNDKQSSMSGTFSDIFASVLGGDSTKQDRQVNYEDLLINLMKILTKMVMTPANPSIDDSVSTYTLLLLLFFFF